MAATLDPVLRQTLEQQYAEICRAHGAITDFRGKLLALFPIAAGGSVLLIVNGDGPLAVGGSLAWARPVGLFALAVTAGLFLYELRQIAECIRLRHQAAAIEDMLGVPSGVAQFRDGPPLDLRVVGVELGSWVVYLTLLSAWLYIAVVGDSGGSGPGLPLVITAAAAVTVVAKAVHIARRDSLPARKAEEVHAVLCRGPASAADVALRIRQPVWIAVAALGRLEAAGRASRTPGETQWRTGPGVAPAVLAGAID